ncbi:hypothetical protein [uncultured Methanocorpusculum sp.]|nr:hypothetical protein [uncultured Methanocorpusculum sp.]
MDARSSTEHGRICRVFLISSCILSPAMQESGCSQQTPATSTGILSSAKYFLIFSSSSSLGTVTQSSAAGRSSVFS